jgi:hypothetical protein
MSGLRTIATASARTRSVLLLSLLAVSLPGTLFSVPARGRDEVQPAPPSPPSPAPYDPGRAQRAVVMCGPNSLYMLLKLHNVPVDHGVIEKHIPSNREGMSLLELQEASNALGLRTQVRRCSIDELQRTFRSPVIAILNLEGGPHHHYVVIVDITQDTVTALDGTTGEKNTFPTRWLKRGWPGYVLMPVSGPSISWLLLAVSPVGWLLLGFLAVKGFLRNGFTRWLIG